MKKCSRCKLEKDLSEFHNASNCKDGKQSQCKMCKSEMSKFYDSRRSKEKRKEYAKNEWQAKKNNPYYKAYREKWLQENKEVVAQKAKEYREKNKISLLTNRSNQRAKKLGVTGKITMQQWQFVLELTNFMCIACEESIADSIDHVVSFHNGGTNTCENIQPMCLRCNLKKGTKDIDFRITGFAESIREKCGE
jgi:5-methylcytosine-specific restriction endonuclease McrA